MTKPLVTPALAQFVTATAGRNMTRPAYVAVAVGVVMMVLLTVAPAYEAAHHWVDAVLWACLAFFMFEWAVRLRHAFLTQRGWGYAASGRGLVDAVGAVGVPLAMMLGVNSKTAWLLGVFWMFGGSRFRIVRLRRVLVDQALWRYFEVS
jgi:voltage-gated potassium channel